MFTDKVGYTAASPYLVPPSSQIDRQAFPLSL